MVIKVYPGCCGGDKVVATVTEAMKQAGVEAEMEVVDDLAQTARDGIMSTPAIKIDGRLAASGRTPKLRDLVALLTSKPT